MALAFNGKGGGGAAPFTGSIVRLSGSASQGTTTEVVPYDTVISDSDSFFSLNDNGFIVPAGKAGIYEYGVTFSATGSVGSTGCTIDLAVQVGNAPNCLYALGAAAASDPFGFGGSLIGKAPFAVGDLVVCRTAAPGGSGVTVDGGNNDGMFWVVRLGNTP